MKRLLPAGLLLLVMGGAVWGETAPPGFDPARHMRVSEIRPGMKGYGLSVFRGTKIERFDVEVISILRNFNPKLHVILVRLKGQNLEHTGGVAGMSGSPIFLKDEEGRERLAGAFAYGWPMGKDPVGGVQPIEYMLTLPVNAMKIEKPAGSNGKESAGPAARPRIRWEMGEYLPLRVEKRGRDAGGEGAENWTYPLFERGKLDLSPFSGAEMRLRPLATPLMVSGMPQKVFEQFEPVFRAHGMMPLQAGGAGGATDEGPVKMEPGSAIAVPIMTGDMDMTAIGTVTEVLGDRVLGFGHAFFSEGEVSLPMGSGYIHSVIANIMNSFKLGSALKVQGTLHADQVVGVAGRIGEAPATIPMDIRCVYADGTLDQTYHFNASLHPKFTPMLAAMSAVIAVSANRELPQYHTVDYDLTMEFANGQKLAVQNRFVNTSPQEIFSTLGSPVQAAADNPFEKVPLKKMSGVLRVSREAREAQILSVSVPKLKYEPGETVKAFVSYRPFREAEAVLPMEFALPRDLPDGAYDFAVLDWQNYLMEEQMGRPFRFTAESSDEVFAVLRDITGVRRDSLYLRLLRQPDGVAIGRTAMPRLPSSRRRVLMGAGLSNTTTFVSSSAKILSTDYVMTGQAHFNLVIDKGAKVDAPGKPGPALPPKVDVPGIKPNAPKGDKPELPAPNEVEPVK
ncbi:MAG TPA: hypothetical protein VGQ99_03170 [Tepidisphaeraceae bacterium]|jgi:hypothetical protein|nr:hypothetical protein [Tepidisphaeraceae bacterium]